MPQNKKEGVIFLIDVVEMILKTGWMFYLVIIIAIMTIIYAIISSVVIGKGKK